MASAELDRPKQWLWLFLASRTARRGARVGPAHAWRMERGFRGRAGERAGGAG